MLESYDVNAVLVGHDTERVSAALGMSNSNWLARHKLPFPGRTVLGTENPADTSTGSRSDLERLAQEMKFVKDDLGAGRERYMLPYYWLGQLFGEVSFSIPTTLPTIKDLYVSLTRLHKEIGDIAEVHEKVLDDNDMSRDDAKKLCKEIYEAMQQLAGYYVSVNLASGKSLGSLLGGSYDE